MPRRAVTVTQLKYHPRYKTDLLRDVAKLPDGVDMLHLVHGMVQCAAPDDFVDEDTGRYASIEKLTPQGRGLLIELDAGPFGDPAKMRDVRSHAVTHAGRADEAVTLPLRTYLVVPRQGTSALLFAEHAQATSSSTLLLRLLDRAWRDRYPDSTLSPSTLLETSAWLDAAELEAVQAVKYGWSSDSVDDTTPKTIGDLRWIFEPPKGSKYFPQRVLEGLRSRTLDRSKLLGLPQNLQPDELIVTLGLDGRSKTFVLEGGEKTPPIRHLLSDTRDPMPTSDEFVKFCQQLAPEHFKSVGVDWDTSWTRGRWKTLCVRLR